MPNPFQNTVCFIGLRLIEKKTDRQNKFKNFVLNHFILMQTTFKPKRILDSNKGRKKLSNDI